MIVVMKGTGGLKHYKLNAKKHPREQLDKIKASIKEFGFRVPVLIDQDSNIIAGHGRVLAARELGLSEVPCIKVGDLTPEQVRAFRIADNKVTESEWLDEFLVEDFKWLEEQGYDVSLTGFDDKEISALMDEGGVGIGEDDFNAEKALESVKYVVKVGDVFKLGSHRLVCGDSTNETDVKLLMGGEKADMVFTDPPYNLGYEYHNYKDNKPIVEYKGWCNKWLNLLNCNKIIITTGKQNLQMWYELIKITDVAVWISKNKMSGGKISNLSLWEPIIFIGEFDRNNRSNDLFEFNKTFQKDVGKNHTCPKQLTLIGDIVKSYSNEKDNILDVFGGSGTTLIACEQLKRKCFMMELDPKYCSVILERWEKFTGLKHEVVDGGVVE